MKPMKTRRKRKELPLLKSIPSFLDAAKYMKNLKERKERIITLSVQVLVQGYLAHKKQPLRRTRQWEHA